MCGLAVCLSVITVVCSSYELTCYGTPVNLVMLYHSELYSVSGPDMVFYASLTPGELPCRVPTAAGGLRVN